MTWGEFKKLIDQQIKDTDLIDQIDVIGLDTLDIQVSRWEENPDDEDPYVHFSVEN